MGHGVTRNGSWLAPWSAESAPSIWCRFRWFFPFFSLLIRRFLNSAPFFFNLKKIKFLGGWFTDENEWMECALSAAWMAATFDRRKRGRWGGSGHGAPAGDAGMLITGQLRAASVTPQQLVFHWSAIYFLCLWLESGHPHGTFLAE